MKGLTSPGASKIRGRPRFRFIIRGSRAAFPLAEEGGMCKVGILGVRLAVGCLGRVAGSIETLGFLGLLGAGVREVDPEVDPEDPELEDDEEGIAFVTLVEVGIRLVLPEEGGFGVGSTPLTGSFGVDTSANPLILRFSAVFKREAN